MHPLPSQCRVNVWLEPLVYGLANLFADRFADYLLRPHAPQGLARAVNEPVSLISVVISNECGDVIGNQPQLFLALAQASLGAGALDGRPRALGGFLC